MGGVDYYGFFGGCVSYEVGVVVACAFPHWDGLDVHFAGAYMGLFGG